MSRNLIPSKLSDTLYISTVDDLKTGDVVFENERNNILIILRASGLTKSLTRLITFFRVRDGEVVTARYFNNWTRCVLKSSSES